jgi:methyl-accepting chemotaxis protein
MRKMKFGAKLITGFMVVSVILLGIGILGIISTKRVDREDGRIIDEELPLTDAIMSAKYEYVMSRELMGEYMLAMNLSEMSKLESEFEKSVTQFNEWTDAVLKGGKVGNVVIVAANDKAVSDMVEKLQGQHAEFEKKAKELMGYHRDYIASSVGEINLTKEQEEWSQNIDAIDQASNKTDEQFDKAEQVIVADIDKAKADADKITSETFFIIVIATGLAFLFAAIFGALIARGAIKAFRKVADVATELAGSSEELSATSQQVAEGAQNQASTLEETSAAVEELTASVEQVSDHSQSQTAAVEQSTSSMNQIQSSVDRVSETLDAVSKTTNEAVSQAREGGESVQKVVDAIKIISDSSSKIAGIVNVISDIADQTNLLALNASIEAARAGEHGRGFAVVADEVSKLADRSASSAKEIEELISESERVVKEGVEVAETSGSAMEAIMNGSQSSSEMVGNLAEALEQQLNAIKEMGKNLENINEMSQSISAATEEQTTNGKQVSRAVENVNELTQQAASAAEEMSASSEQLSSMAQELQSMMEELVRLKVDTRHKTTMSKQPAGRLYLETPAHKEEKEETEKEITDITLKKSEVA